jgi:uncharacterized protein (DUF2147 family)
MVIMIRVFVACLAVFVLIIAAPAQAASTLDRAVGYWLTEDQDGGVELYRCGEELCGKFRWLGTSDPAPDSDAGRDTKNKDPQKRSRPLCDMQFMGGFKFDGKDSLVSGWIYSPRHGGDFSASITQLDDNRIQLRGYFLIPALGQNQIWTRKTDMPTCRQLSTKE